MSVVVVLGALFGLGTWLVVSGLRPAREPLAVVLARLAQPTRSAVSLSQLPPPPTQSASTTRVAALAERVPAVRRILGRAEADLRVVGRSREEQAARMVILPMLGLLLGPAVLTAGTVTAGLGVTAIPVWVAPLGAVAGWLYARAELGVRAREARTRFREAVAAFCDVSSIALASGLGVEQSLTAAARGGDGWAFREMRYALEAGRLNNLRPWDALDRAGAELELPDLQELAAAVRLAGDEGAAVAATIAQKGRSLRDRLASEAERASVSTTERMSIPAALMLVGMFAFLLYPALYAITR